MERLVGEEQVEGLDHLVDHDARALDVVQGHVDLARAVEHVGRASRAQQGHGDDEHEQTHQDQRREQGHHLGAEMGGAEHDGVARQHPHPRPHGKGGQHHVQPPQPATPGPFSGHGHVRGRSVQHLVPAQRSKLHVLLSPLSHRAVCLHNREWWQTSDPSLARH